MAIDKRLQIYDEQGNLVDYDILASDVKFLSDGKDLPTKLAEMQDEIEDAGSGDGTVTGVKIGSTTYEPTDGVVDLSSPMGNKVDKETGKGLSTNDYTTAEKTKLGSLPTNPVQTISVNGGTPQSPVNGNVNISVEGAAGEDGKSAYQSYLDTTSDNPKKTEAEWVASLHGQDGVQSGDDVVVVHDLDGTPTSGFDPAEQVAVLGADMGAVLKDMIDALDEGTGYDISVVDKTLVIASANTERVIVGAISNNSVSCKAGNTATATFYVSGKRLTNNIAISVSDQTNWSVSPASISPSDGSVPLTLVTVTYNPASGTTAGTTHNCTVTISCGGTTHGSIAMTGTVASAPSITLDPTSLTINTVSGTDASGTINVKGAALEGDITLTLSDTTHFSFSENSTVATATVTRTDAEASGGDDVTVYFDGGADDEEVTITASSTNASNATCAVAGNLVTAPAVGDTFEIDGIHYKVTSVSPAQVKVINTNGDASSTASTYSGAITIPNTVTYNGMFAFDVVSIGNKAFYKASGLTSVIFGNNITSVGDTAFGYSSLSSVTLNSGLTTIGYQSFFSCSNLTSISLPSTVTSVDRQNFISDANLATVVLNSVFEIKTKVFDGCKITSFTINSESNPPSFATNAGYGGSSAAFSAIQSGAKLYVPSSMVSTYQANTNWAGFFGSANIEAIS